MLVTDMAMQDMSERSESFLRRVVQALLHPFRPDQVTPTNALVSAGSASSSLVVVAFTTRQDDTDHPLRKHPRLRRAGSDTEPQPVDLPARRARASGVRAVLLAREGRFDEARSAFHAAALADDALDLSDFPGFWDLSRRGMFAAIQAYEDLERYREASALEAQIRRTYRPRMVPGGSPVEKVASGR